MTLQKWIKDRAIHGYPTFSIEDVRNTGMYSSEQMEKPSVFDPRGQAMLTLTGKI